MKNKYYDWPWKPMDTIPVDNELNTLLRLNPNFPLRFHMTICLNIKMALLIGINKVL